MNEKPMRVYYFSGGYSTLTFYQSQVTNYTGQNAVLDSESNLSKRSGVIPLLSSPTEKGRQERLTKMVILYKKIGYDETRVGLFLSLTTFLPPLLSLIRLMKRWLYYHSRSRKTRGGLNFD